MEATFYLKRPNDDRETVIYARISYQGEQLKYYLPENINPKHWSKDTHRAKETKKFPGYPEFNARLDSIATTIKNVFRRYQNDNDSAVPSPEAFKKLLDVAIKKTTDKKSPANTLLPFFLKTITSMKDGKKVEYKTGKPFSPNTIKTYVSTYNHLSSFDQSRRKKLSFESIDLEFYNDFTGFLMKQLNLSPNSIGKDIKVLKTVLNDATELGINKNLQFKSKKFSVTKEPTSSIYLNAKELHEVQKLDLADNPRLDRVRDLFLIGCYTGLRFSDFSVLKPEHVKEGFITITQTKTEQPVVIPVHTQVERIFKKYNGNIPIKKISNQKMNAYLKEIGQLIPCLQEKLTKTITKGGIKRIVTICKWIELKTHTARRSFATNQYLSGLGTLTIMSITGHRTEKAFMGYIKATPNEHAKLLGLHWLKQEELIAI